MNPTPWFVGTILLVALILGGFHYAAEQSKADALVVKACIERGGSFYVSWNWRNVCELKAKP